jgi:long-chain acyl-CoA synthetase
MTPSEARAAYDARPWTALYPSGIADVLAVGPTDTALSLFQATTQATPDAVAIHYFETTITFAELDAQSDAVAAHLAASGVNDGDRVAVYLQNDPQFAISQLAVWKAGGVMVSVNPMLKAKELLFILEDSGAVSLIALETLFDAIVRPIRDQIDIGCVVTTSPFDWASESRRDDVADLIRVAGPRQPFDRPDDVDDLRAIIDRYDASAGAPSANLTASDAACLVYTSGTSGRPKGVVNTHANLVYNSEVYRVWMQMDSNDRYLCMAPLFHITGLVAGLALTYRAAVPIVLYHRHDPGLALELSIRHECTFSVMVVTAYVSLMQHPDIASFDLTGLTKPYSGGAAVSPAVSNDWFELTGSRLHNVYGLTETTSPSHAWPLGADGPVDDESGALSVGVPVPGAEVLIVDPKSLEAVAPGEVGEIWIRGPMVTPGYWERPDANSTEFVDGFLRTGDVGKMDDDGWFFLVDRLKDMINVSGYKVWPREVEDCLSGHPEIAESAVVGIADEYRGETVKAVIVRSPGSSLDADDVITFCKERMAAYKYPRIVEFIDELPKTASGKVLRRELRD